MNVSCMNSKHNSLRQLTRVHFFLFLHAVTCKSIKRLKRGGRAIEKCSSPTYGHHLPQCSIGCSVSSTIPTPPREQKDMFPSPSLFLSPSIFSRLAGPSALVPVCSSDGWLGRWVLMSTPQQEHADKQRPVQTPASSHCTTQHTILSVSTPVGPNGYHSHIELFHTGTFFHLLCF